MATYLILGANRGIGLQLAKQLGERGEQVIAVCRHGSDELSALPARVIDGVELTDSDSLLNLQQQLADLQIDVLVHVAGILRGDDLDSLSLEQMRQHFEVNTLAPLASLKALRGNLAAGSKVFILSSRVGSIADNSSGGNYAYRVSKTAVNMVGVNLAHDLKPYGISVHLLHPGYVQTDMTGHRGNLAADESAAGLIEQMDRLGLEDAGTFWHASGEQLEW